MNSEFIRIENETEKTFCYTYYRIVGDFPADEVVKMLNIEPYKADISGDCSNLDFALCDTYDVLVENQMRKTIAPFKDKVDILNKIKEKYDVSFFLEVVPKIYVDETHPVLAPPLDVMEFCVKTQTEIDIDMYVYPKESPLIDKMESILRELGFKHVSVGDKDYTYWLYGDTYCKLTYVKSMNAIIVETADKLKAAELGVLEDSGVYYLDIPEDELLEGFKNDIIKYYMS